MTSVNMTTRGDGRISPNATFPSVRNGKKMGKYSASSVGILFPVIELASGPRLAAPRNLARRSREITGAGGSESILNGVGGVQSVEGVFSVEGRGRV
jgi:hypothetical protein